jgi:CHAD domain-containing protein
MPAKAVIDTGSNCSIDLKATSDPVCDLADFFLVPFDQRWAEYRANLDICRVGLSEEKVHDLRVATRRLLAVLEIIWIFDQHSCLKKLRRSLKAQLDGFDDLRDVQVMLAIISENIENLSNLEPFQQYLEKREKRLMRAAKKQVCAIKSTNINQRLLKVRESLMAQFIDDFPSRLLQAADKAYQKVKQRYGWIDPDLPATIHSVRVAFKKFRYIIECVQPVLPGFPETQFKRMRDYQTLMGNIQDAEVFLQALLKFSTRRTELELTPTHRLAEQRFSRALSIYLDHKEELYTFWRADPQSEFPWTSNSPKMELV